MPNILLQILREFAVTVGICTANSLVEKAKGRKKKMDEKKIMSMIAQMIGSIGELEFDKLTSNQKSVATATIDAMSKHKEITDFVTTMIFMCSEGAKEMDATADDCKIIWQAILNDIASPQGIKFTIE